MIDNNRYRLWDSTEKKMFIVESMAWDDRELTCITTRQHSSLLCHHQRGTFGSVLMQSYGQPDSQGTEIFEDDLLEIHLKGSVPVLVWCRKTKIRRRMYSGHLVEITGFCFVRPDDHATYPIVKNWQGKHDVECMTIKGNRHANLELMEDFNASNSY